MKKILLLFLVTFLLWPQASQAQVNAEPTITVSPGSFEIDLLPGELVRQEIRLQNDSNLPLPIKIKTISFEAADEVGGMRFYEDVVGGNESAQNWLQPEKKEFLLSPQEQVLVPVDLLVPKDAWPGGRYVVMLFEPQLPSFYFTDKATKIVPVVGVLFLINVQSETGLDWQKPLIKILGVDWSDRQRMMWQGLVVGIEKLLAFILPTKAVAGSQPVFFFEPPTTLRLRLQNNQIFHIKPQGIVRTYNIFSHLTTESEVKPFTILPKKVRELNVPLGWQKNTGFFPDVFGRYVIDLSLRINGGLVFNQSYVLWILPIGFLLSTVSLIGLFTFFVLKFKGRIKKFLIILFTGKP